MKLKRTVLLGLVIAFSCGNDTKEAVDHQQSESVNQAQLNLIYKHGKPFPNGTQLAFAFIADGKVEFYGTSRVNDSIMNVNNADSVFEIGSITKVFTSTLLAQMVVEKKVKLDDPIRDYLPFPLKDTATINLKQLANHTSGLPRLPSNLNLFFADPTNPYKHYTETDLLKYLKSDMKLNQKPGTKSEYSNLGAGLLAYIISKKENATYESLLQQRIFKPLNMSSSTADRKLIESKLVKGRDAKGKAVSNWDLSVLEGAGAILSSVKDLSKFAIAQFDESNQVYKLTRTSTFTINANTEIGLGWHLIKNTTKNMLVWHNGGTGGYSSSLAIDPINKTGIIILSNVSAFHKDRGNIDKLCFELMKTFEQK